MTLKQIFVVILVLNFSDVYGIKLRGKGASFPNEVYRLWIPAYKSYRKSYVDLDMTYEVVGIGIYNGTYRYWNDTSLQESNPNSTMPHRRIIVIARADNSGTTSLFTSALSSFCPSWKNMYGHFSEGLNSDTDLPYHWGSDVISYYGLHNRGVSGLVISFKYSIAYLSVADAYETNLPTAEVMNKAGYFVQATTESVQKAVAFHLEETHDSTLTIIDADSQNAYPIIGLTNFIMYQSTMANCDSAKELVRYIHWFMTGEKQRKICEEKGMSPLSHKLVNQITQSVLKVITCQGQNIWKMVQHDIENENQQDEVWVAPVSVTVSICILAILVLLSFIIYQKIKILNVINRNDWNIPIEEIIFIYDAHNEVPHRSKLSGSKSLKSSDAFGEIEIPESEVIGEVLQWPGKWKGHQIGLRLLELKHFNHVTLEMKKCMMWMRENIVHLNVVRFYGLTELDNLRYVIGEYCMKGPMTNILQDHKFNLSDDFKFCLMNDIAFGMQFLHSQGLVHGALTSSACVIDNRWIVKISDWEFNKLSLLTFAKENSATLRYVRKDTCRQELMAFEDFWVAPEILKSDYRQPLSPDCDVFSYSIILQEIFTREYPYIEHAEYMIPSQVVRAIIYNNLRPEVPSDIPVVVRQVMEIAWSDDPLCRPSFDQILKMIRNTRSGGRSILDAMMESMEHYTAQLEQKIEEQTLEIAASQETTDKIKTKILPTEIIPSEENGFSVDSKICNSLCIAIAEVCHFDDFKSDSTVAEFFSIINFLNAEMHSLGKRHSIHVDIDSGSFIIISGLGKQ
ncbi:hypothetical protein KUTeg_019941 [Tegillarca granosa]|uniref:Protein kinase domain-containing protein n=1 Tax=Tegillarca granosa TaxID=220873 RepID=A0ABQ9EEF8_TEGGR|nr:hypothetical protein KUTeg_019941 [Tegillarca granosa]